MNPYLKTKIMTAKPEELRLMLYEGAIKFCRQACDALGRGDWEKMHGALLRAQKIVLELSTTLNHKVDPELCGKLAALYNYIYRQLVDANVERNRSLIDEAIGLLDYERETWLMVMKKLRNGDGSELGGEDMETLGRIGPSGAEQERKRAAMSSLSIQG